MVQRIILVSFVVLGWFPVQSIVDCSADESPQLCAISGQIVSENGASKGWVVFNSNDGKITAICDQEADVPAGSTIIQYDGYIFPGLIDTHNHVHWNSIPLWRTGEYYNIRYEWQATTEYKDEVRDPYNAINDAGLWYNSFTYGEIRALIGGTTTIQGTEDSFQYSGPSPHYYLVRNLDFPLWGVESYVSNIMTYPVSNVPYIIQLLQMEYIERLFLHVGEGKRTDPDAMLEFPYLQSIGLAVPSVVIIHGVALDAEDFAAMAENDMYLVWSPKSNLVLYGETADIESALDAGVTVALAPDWTISGSDNVLEELKVAYNYSLNQLDGRITPKQLFQMVTTNAAIVAGADEETIWIDEKLGKIETGYEADFFLAPIFDDDPHVSLLKTYSKDIHLVFIDGKPVYGDRAPMRQLINPDNLDEIVVSHKKKAICIIDPYLGDIGLQHYNELVGSLESVIGDIAEIVEDEPESKPGYPRNLN